MKKNNLRFLTADECTEALSDVGILTNTKGPKPGFNFREMLRQCRDGVLNDLVCGGYQKKPGARRKISYVG
ncbi:hypothetical protein [Sphingobacterium sp. UBA1897]|uniref:hypothetical protein n=1 Tax=Sphingobacterium sp. UBA1897 TaxID=1947486 RepID=UPI00257BE3B5|nr:hypothetical protein [Sphingobacterium sp. UBA1897]